MTFNEHSRLIGQHAFLGASKYHWINYDADKLTTAYTNFMAAQKGTELHEFAARCIALGQKLPRSKKTLNRYSATLKIVSEQRIPFASGMIFCVSTTSRPESYRHTWNSCLSTMHCSALSTELNRAVSRSKTASTSLMIFSLPIRQQKTSSLLWRRSASLIRLLQR